MAGSNGASGIIEMHADRTGVFGRVPQTLPFGGSEVTIKRLSNGEMKGQLALIQSQMNYNRWADEASVGELYYAGAMVSDEDWQRLVKWLGYWTEPKVTVKLLDVASADETIALINVIFEQSGMNWLRRTVGNAVRAFQQVMREMPLPANLPSLPESASTSSTNSSSPAPDLQPTPEPTSPETG